ncbi:MAG: NosD domain-containing protein [Candidatus Thorarchaeota archaeon]
MTGRVTVCHLHACRCGYLTGIQTDVRACSRESTCQFAKQWRHIYRWIAITVILLFVLGNTVSCFNSTLTASPDTQRATVPCSVSQKPDPPIEILSDTDFVAQGWPGSGTKDDPYLIDGVLIASGDICIRVANTTAYFVIRNSRLSGMDEQGRGVVLENVAHGTVITCIFSNLTVGVSIDNSMECTIQSNALANLWDGMNARQCSDVAIINNTMMSGSGEHGVVLYECANCTVTENYVPDISLLHSSHCTITGNTLWDDGLTIDPSVPSDWYHHVTDNYLLGKEIGYFLGASDRRIDGRQLAQLILVDCKGLTVEGGVFRHLSRGIEIVSSSNCNVTNFIASDNRFGGIYVVNCQDVVIRNGSVGYNTYEGVTISESDRVVLEDTAIYNNSLVGGVIVEASRNCVIRHSTIANNSRGALLSVSSGCTLRENIIITNDVGIELVQSNSCQVISNEIAQNRVGLLVESGSCGNTIYWNSFFYNNLNAKDNGVSNAWDDGVSRGNGWSDYAYGGMYAIPGSAGSVDRFPWPATHLTDAAELADALGILVVTITPVVPFLGFWCFRLRKGEGTTVDKARRPYRPVKCV